MNDRLEVFKLLIREGASVHGCNCEARTPLFFAALNKDLTYANLLLENGARVNARVG
jgi:ankyrin repeat protein